MSALVAVVWLLGLADAAEAAKPKEHPAKADLIADVTTVQPGRPFHLAVRITLQPHWHVYWINPGDSGQATAMKFNVPPGWEVEPLAFPTPTEFKQPGDMVGYGYENAVLFLAKVTPSADAGGPAEVSAAVEWLVCDDERCLPGKGSPTLTLDVGEKPAPANQDLFRRWLERVPAAGTVQKVGPASQGEQEVVVTLDQPAKNVQAFPAPPLDWVIENLKTAADEKSVRVTFKPRPLNKDGKPLVMPVLIAYDDAGGVRRSVLVTYSMKP